MTGQINTTRNAPPERTRFKLDGRSVALDHRVHAARGDLADISLAGVLFSAHYARAVELTCVAPGAPILSQPSHNAEAVSELLRGEASMRSTSRPTGPGASAGMTAMSAISAATHWT